MKRVDKERYLSKICGLFSSYSFLVLVNFKGVTAEELSVMRASLKGCCGGGVMIVKNTLARIAVQRNDQLGSVLGDKFYGPVMVFYSEDIISASKIIKKFASSGEKMKVLCATYESKLLDAGKVMHFAKLTSLEDVRMKAMSLLSFAIPARLAFCMKHVKN